MNDVCKHQWLPQTTHKRWDSDGNQIYETVRAWCPACGTVVELIDDD